MTIKVLAICYNEEKLLPFFLAHYEKIADEIIIYDNHSTDRSQDIIRSHPKTKLVTYSTRGKLDDKIYLTIKNNAWKKYAKNTDWFIVVDMDEFLFHPYLKLLLWLYTLCNISLPQTQGYNMVSNFFPTDSKQPLVSTLHNGVRTDGYSKDVIFNPQLIKEINYGPGAHSSSPKGKIKRSGRRELVLLHYKYFGLHYLKERAKQYAPRLKNVQYDWGQKEYLALQHADRNVYLKESKAHQARIVPIFHFHNQSLSFVYILTRLLFWGTYLKKFR